MLRRSLSILPKLGTIVLAGYLFWLGWTALGPRKPEAGPIRQELADRAVLDIVEDIRASRGGLRDVALLHFANDPTDYFTDTLREAIEENGVLDLRDLTLSEKIFGLLNFRHETYGERERAISRAESLGVQGVLYGSVYAFESYPGGAEIDVEVNLVDVASGEAMFSSRYRVDSSSAPAITAVQEATRSFPWFHRLLGWLIAVLLLPVFTIMFIRTMVRKGSNKANAFVLGIYTLVDAILAWLLVGAAISSWFPVVVFILAVIAAFLYNVRVMTLAIRLEET